MISLPRVPVCSIFPPFFLFLRIPLKLTVISTVAVDQLKRDDVFLCIICSKDLTKYNTIRRENHFNNCLDKKREEDEKLNPGIDNLDKIK